MGSTFGDCCTLGTDAHQVESEISIDAVHTLNLVQLMPCDRVQEKKTPEGLGEREQFEPGHEKTNFGDGDVFAKAADKSVDANEHLIWAVKRYIGKSVYEAPPWADEKLKYVPAYLGCASTVCNLLRLAMKHAKVIGWDDTTSRTDLFQINIDKLLPILEAPPYNSQEIKPMDVKPGDLVVGLGPGAADGHMGIVGSIENGRRQVYDNKEGVVVKESLTERFKKYETRRYLRVHF